jgi:hypothetical protein
MPTGIISRWMDHNENSPIIPDDSDDDEAIVHRFVVFGGTDSILTPGDKVEYAAAKHVDGEMTAYRCRLIDHSTWLELKQEAWDAKVAHSLAMAYAQILDYSARVEANAVARAAELARPNKPTNRRYPGLD